jgi:hypothetical protein
MVGSWQPLNHDSRPETDPRIQHKSDIWAARLTDRIASEAFGGVVGVVGVSRLFGYNVGAMRQSSIFRFRLIGTQHRGLLRGSTKAGMSASEIVRRGIGLALAEHRTEEIDDVPG